MSEIYCAQYRSEGDKGFSLNTFRIVGKISISFSETTRALGVVPIAFDRKRGYIEINSEGLSVNEVRNRLNKIKGIN